MPWDQNNDHGKTRGLQNNDEYSEERLKGLLTDICPLVDRLGRAFTDLSPHLQRYCQPASTEASAPPTRPQAIRQGLFPFGPLLSRQMFVFILLFFYNFL